MSTRIDKPATRTSPERPPEWTRTTRMSTEATGLLHSFLRTCTLFTGIPPGVLTVCWGKVAQTLVKLSSANSKVIWLQNQEWRTHLRICKMCSCLWHHENNLFFHQLFLQKCPSHGNVYICGHCVKAKYIKCSQPEDAGLSTELPVATRRLPGGIR